MIKVVDSAHKYRTPILPDEVEPPKKRHKGNWKKKRAKKSSKPAPKRKPKNYWKGVLQKKGESWKQYYKRYMDSPCWKRIRERTLEADKHKCILCESKATHILHWWYPKIYGREKPSSLSSMCEDCHILVRSYYKEELDEMKKCPEKRGEVKERVIRMATESVVSELDEEYLAIMGKGNA